MADAADGQHSADTPRIRTPAAGEAEAGGKMAAEIALTEEEWEHLESLQGPEYHAVYAPYSLSRAEGGPVLSGPALLDTGNTLRAEVISEDVKDRLQLKMQDTSLKGKTANAQDLRVLGRAEAVELHIPGVAQRFNIRPIVIQGMTSGVNLGSKFNFELRVTPQLLKIAGDGQERNFARFGGEEVRLFARDTAGEEVARLLEPHDHGFPRGEWVGSQAEDALSSTTPHTHYEQSSKINKYLRTTKAKYLLGPEPVEVAHRQVGGGARSREVVGTRCPTGAVSRQRAS
jgi:hypothetical protein